MYNVKDMDWMLKSMSIHQNNNKRIVESNFVTSCLAFRGSIPTISCLGFFLFFWSYSSATDCIFYCFVFTHRLVYIITSDTKNSNLESLTKKAKVDLVVVLTIHMQKMSSLITTEKLDGTNTFNGPWMLKIKSRIESDGVIFLVLRFLQKT